MSSHRFFDHTGDYGVDLCAATEEALYEASIAALVELLVDDVGSIREAEERSFELEGLDAEELLVGLGNEVLFLFETGWLTKRVEVEVDGDRIVATARGEPFDEVRHPIARPIKAVTHHGAAVGGADNHWTGRLIFDL